jgi:Na+-translocating ferredoxin:NAD+ oxidoreductase RnfD subunit
MYVVTIALLLALAIAGAYQAGAFPLALVAAVATCVLVEFAISKLKKHGYRIPLAAIITGLIIGSVAPLSVPVAVVVLAALVAEFTKFFVKAKARNIFNPAAMGLLVALIAFGAGDEWWASPSFHVYGLLVPLAAVLLISAYEARRLHLALTVAVVLAIGAAALSGFAFSAGGLLASFLSANYYFAFLMATDPKTSPSRISGQVAYGIGIAVIALVFIWARLSYPMLVALVLGNIFYALFRVFYRRTAPVAAGAVASAQ